MQVLSSSNVWQLPGTVNTAVETGPEKDKQQCSILTKGGTGVIVMSQSCSLVSQSRKTEAHQEMKHAVRLLLSGTLERSNPNRELVKRKASSDVGQRIRKRIR